MLAKQDVFAFRYGHCKAFIMSMFVLCETEHSVGRLTVSSLESELKIIILLLLNNSFFLWALVGQQKSAVNTIMIYYHP